MDTQLIHTNTVGIQSLLPLLVTYQMMPQFLVQTILDRAIQTIDCTVEEIAQATQEIDRNWSLNSETERQEWRSHYGMTQAAFEQFATRSIRIEKFKQIQWEHKIESYFLGRKQQLDRVIYSMLRLTDEDTAQELYFRIVEQEQSFTEAARQYSQGVEAQTGGLLGPVELGTLHPQLANLLYTSAIGQIQTCALGDWYLIVRLEKRLPAQLDDSMRQRLLDEQLETWIQAQIERLSDREKAWFSIAST